MLLGWEWAVQGKYQGESHSGLGFVGWLGVHQEDNRIETASQIEGTACAEAGRCAVAVCSEFVARS